MTDTMRRDEVIAQATTLWDWADRAWTAATADELHAVANELHAWGEPTHLLVDPEWIWWDTLAELVGTTFDLHDADLAEAHHHLALHLSELERGVRINGYLDAAWSAWMRLRPELPDIRTDALVLEPGEHLHLYDDCEFPTLDDDGDQVVVEGEVLVTSQRLVVTHPGRTHVEDLRDVLRVDVRDGVVTIAITDGQYALRAVHPWTVAATLHRAATVAHAATA